MKKLIGLISLEVMKFLSMMGMVVAFATNQSNDFLFWTFALLGLIILKETLIETLIDNEVRE